jgi:hypothetical protein
LEEETSRSSFPIDGSDGVVSRNGGGGVCSLRERRGLQAMGLAGSGSDGFGEAWRRRGLAAARSYAGGGGVDSLLSTNLVAFLSATCPHVLRVDDGLMGLSY